MNALAGILLLLNAHGVMIAQPLPQLPGYVCMAHVGDKTAECWAPVSRIDGTTGYTMRRVEIALQTRQK